MNKNISEGGKCEEENKSLPTASAAALPPCPISHPSPFFCAQSLPSAKSRTSPGTFFSAPPHLAPLCLLLASSHPSSRSPLTLSRPVGAYPTADTSAAQPPSLWHSLALVVTHRSVLGYNIHHPWEGWEGSWLPPFPSLQRRFLLLSLSDPAPVTVPQSSLADPAPVTVPQNQALGQGGRMWAF